MAEIEIIKEAFELYPRVLYPNIFDNRFIVDVNLEERNKWIEEQRHAITD